MARTIPLLFYARFDGFCARPGCQRACRQPATTATVAAAMLALEGSHRLRPRQPEPRSTGAETATPTIDPACAHHHRERRDLHRWRRRPPASPRGSDGPCSARAFHRPHRHAELRALRRSGAAIPAATASPLGPSVLNYIAVAGAGGAGAIGTVPDRPVARLRDRQPAAMAAPPGSPAPGLRRPAAGQGCQQGWTASSASSTRRPARPAATVSPPSGLPAGRNYAISYADGTFTADPCSSPSPRT